MTVVLCAVLYFLGARILQFEINVFERRRRVRADAQAAAAAPAPAPAANTPAA
ncbi:MAG: hypothetical protein M1836_000905 [Candelina mexicana]|nr:MAG: hypothetical protein M1836_000905 [Candelina mexicana]